MILDYGGDIPTPIRKPGMLWGSGSLYHTLSILLVQYIANTRGIYLCILDTEDVVLYRRGGDVIKEKLPGESR